jgi:hypothetical protein
MKHPLLTIASLTLFGFATAATVSFADEGHHHGDDSTAANESHHAHHGEHGHGDSAAGRPGNAKKISRTIKITALDIKYDKPEIQVKAGETIKFVLTNAAKLRHEKQRDRRALNRRFPKTRSEQCSRDRLC